MRFAGMPDTSLAPLLRDRRLSVTLTAAAAAQFGATLAGLGGWPCPLMSFAGVPCPVRQFKTAGPVHGIIGIITCSLWTFIWGWMNAGKLNIRNLMIIWTIVIILCIVLTIVGGGMAFSYGVGSGVTP